MPNALTKLKDNPMPRFNQRKYILHLAAKGVPVFPVNTDKTPRVSRWQTVATTDPKKIEEWFNKYGDDCWFGMPTGNISGIWAIDVDVKKGKKGLEFFQEKLKDLPDTVTQLTPTEGRHHLYQYDPNNAVNNRTDIFGKDSGIDIRGDGGYIVLAFSGGYSIKQVRDENNKLTNKTKIPSEVTKLGEEHHWVYDLINANKVKSLSKPTEDRELIEEPDLRAALFALDANDEEFCTRDGWQQLLRAVHSGSGGADWGKQMFTEWSLTNGGPWEKPVEQEIDRDWSSYDPSGPTSVGSLYYHIQKRGLVVRRGTTVEDALVLSSTTPKFIRSKSKNGDGRILPNPHNAMEYLRASHLGKDPNPFHQLFVFNEFTRDICWFRQPSWDKNISQGDPIADPDITNMRAKVAYLHTENVDFGKDTMRDAVTAYAYGNRTHPIKNFLKTLVWDGTPRLDTWLIEACGLEDNEYTRAVGRKTLIAAVARVMKPGCKVDTVMVLEGPQGCRKSTLVEVMGYKGVKGRNWHAAPNLNIAGLSKGDTSAVTDTFGSWIMEMPEMACLTKADESMVKSFLSTSEDKVTLKYDKYATTTKRQFILIGTVNPYGEGRYIKDHTGARRYWPIRVARTERQPINTEAVAGVMDQLYAEATVAYKKGEHWYLEGKAHDLAIIEQSQRIEGNNRMADVDMFFTHGQGSKLDKVHTADISREIWPHEKVNQYMRDTVTEYLTAMGWEYKRNLVIDSANKSGFLKCSN